ncbi:MAG: hypothetical protein Q4C71_05340, partial [Microbacteriaceae bacterium]|nr:hypothetical protein [Microbacteriaceae bacterium]
LLGNKKIVQVAAVLGCIAMVQMPFIPVQWGTLYANMLGLCLTPYILCGVLYLFKLTRKDTDPLSIFAAFFLTFGALGAAVLAHPTAIFPPLILTAILILRNALKTWKNTEYTSRQKLFAWGLVVLITIVSAIIWYKTKNEVTWKPHLTYNAAFSNGFSGSTGFTVTDWLTGFTALFGTYLTFRNKQLRWLTVLYVSFVGLWIITASFKSGLLRSALSAPWYADHWRLAMQVPLVSVVLSAIAITFIGHKILAQTPKIKARFGSFVARLFPTGVTLATGILLLNSVGYAQATQNTTDVFRATPEAAPLLSLNERDVLLHLDKVAQKGDKVAGNPWTGTALATAFTKADALFPHLLGDYSEDYYELAEKIATGAGKACKIAAELQVKYVLDFGDKQVLQSWLERDFYGPIVNLDKKDTPALTKIYSKGNARLYEITGCKN